MKQFKQILLTGILLFCIAPALFSQVKKHSLKPVSVNSVQKNTVISRQLKIFLEVTERANVVFNFPKGFKEVKAPDNEDVSFDYALNLPGEDFEMWLQVRSQKENYASYERSLDNEDARQDNPDSLYIGLGTAQALAFSGDNNFLTRSITPNIIARYNADAGRSYLINLPDKAVTKHYKYALIMTLQKDHTGTILAVCLANEKGPEFFKNIDRATNCVKFKP